MENHEENQYLEILKTLVEKAEKTSEKDQQKGPQDVAAVNMGLTTMSFDVSDGTIPLLTTKKVSLKNVVVELLWFLTGESNLNFMHEHKVHFWDSWATEEISSQYGYEEGDVGPIYGPNWRRWVLPSEEKGSEVKDQFEWLINGLKTNPQWRRWKVVAWNPANIDKAFLAPCHGDFHCIMVEGKLELHHFQRSGDWFIGIPYNIASYSVLLHMLCQVTGLKPGKFVQVTSDTHLYVNHIEPAKEQLSRKPKKFPKLVLDKSIKDIDSFKWPDHFSVEDYDPHPLIRAEVAI